MKHSLCYKCSSRAYCANRESGMLACINFNKFPRPELSYSEYMARKHNDEEDVCDSKKF